MTALLHSDCPKLQLIATGKVRDIYSLPDDPSVLLFVTTDRVSAFDVTMKNVLSFLSATLLWCLGVEHARVGHPVQRPTLDSLVRLLVRSVAARHSQPHDHLRLNGHACFRP